jgi:hypothetical protein
MSHDPDRPFALRYLSVIYYLSDVDETSHGFSIVPEDVATKRSRPQGTDGANARPVFGEAGTAILFNAGSCHAAVLRRTRSQRRTAQIYYGHASDTCISNDTIAPERFFHPTSKACQLVRRTNVLTRLVREHC